MYPQQIYLKSDVFQNSPKGPQNILATLARKFVTKNFQKSPNLVTLVVSTDDGLKFKPNGPYPKVFLQTHQNKCSISAQFKVRAHYYFFRMRLRWAASTQR